MGKSPGGAVWLNAEMLQPLRVLAVLAQHRPTPTSAGSSSSTPSCRSTNATGSARSAASEINAAKIALANEVTTLCTARRRPPRPRRPRARCSRQGGVGEELDGGHDRRDTLGGGLASTHFLVATALVGSGKEAKRLIGEKGLALQQRTGARPQRAGHAPRRDRRRPQGLDRQEAPRAGPAGRLRSPAAAPSARKSS